MDARRLRFQSAGLTLEAFFYSGEGSSPDGAVVVCHPHPQYGGDMHNNVVQVIVAAAVAAGLGALAFNFRGVGASDGSYDQGTGEQDDVRAALVCARSLPGIKTVGLAGYSFGAAMAAAAVDDGVAALALVSLPAAMADRDTSRLSSYSGRALLVSGANDAISPEPAIRQVAASMRRPSEVVIVPGADHFWWGRERELTETVTGFFETALAPSPS